MYVCKLGELLCWQAYAGKWNNKKQTQDMKDITILSRNWIHVLLILLQKQQGKEYREEQILSALYLCICICVFLYLHLWEKKCPAAWWIAFCLLFTILAPFLSTWTNHLSASLLPSSGTKVYFLYSRRLFFCISIFGKD